MLNSAALVGPGLRSAVWNRDEAAFELSNAVGGELYDQHEYTCYERFTESEVGLISIEIK